MSLFIKIFSSFLLVLACGCTYVTSSLTDGFGNDLGATLADSDDPDTVRQALPSYLLTLDALVRDSDNAGSFWSAARLNSFYAGQFAVSAEQKHLLADKALAYAERAACLQDSDWCGVTKLSQVDLQSRVAKADKDDAGLLYQLGTTWATWLEANSGDWNAVAQLGKVRLLMQRVVELDETRDHGNAHVYLGVLDTLLPAAMGGKPDSGREHFERAIELSAGNNLMAKTLYAERYARLVFDRELHDRLLNEVSAADAHVPGLTLANTLAKQKAAQLLSNADNYF